MKIFIIDYGAGNVESVFNALKTINDQLNIIISSDINEIKSATHLILPGVGAFGDCVNGLKISQGFIGEMRKQIVKEKKPFLGICVGMQVLASIGYENGEHQGLGFINGKVEKINNLTADNKILKIPHMGWNNLLIKNAFKIICIPHVFLYINGVLIQDFYGDSEYDFTVMMRSVRISKRLYEKVKLVKLLKIIIMLMDV
jgi:glutamine amidotransferase